MKTIVLTGISKPEFTRIKNKLKGITRCYLCKRNQAHKGVYYDPYANSANTNELSFTWIETIQHYTDGDIKFKFYLCHECLALIEAVQEKSIFGRINT